MTIQLSRRGFLGTLAAVALLGRATVKAAEPEPVLTPGLYSISIDRVKTDHYMICRPEWADRHMIKDLAADMGEHGHLNPILMRTNGRLIDGRCRLWAAQDLGWKYITARVI